MSIVFSGQIFPWPIFKNALLNNKSHGGIKPSQFSSQISRKMFCHRGSFFISANTWFQQFFAFAGATAAAAAPNLHVWHGYRSSACTKKSVTPTV